MRVCVFCGSSTGRRAEYAKAAEAMGVALAEQHADVVYGGGTLGLMGIVASAAARGGSAVTGVLPRPFVAAMDDVGDDDVVGNDLVGDNNPAESGSTSTPRGTRRTLLVPDMHTRKRMMADLADAFVVLPGGLGTLEELFEMATWTQLAVHAKPVGLLNTCGFFDPLLALVDHLVDEGFLRAETRAVFVVDDNPKELLRRVAAFHLPSGAQFPLRWDGTDVR